MTKPSFQIRLEESVTALYGGGESQDNNIAPNDFAKKHPDITQAVKNFGNLNDINSSSWAQYAKAILEMGDYPGELMASFLDTYTISYFSLFRVTLVTQFVQVFWVYGVMGSLDWISWLWQEMVYLWVDRSMRTSSYCDTNPLLQIAGYGEGGYNDGDYNDGQVGFYGLVLPVEYWASA